MADTTVTPRAQRQPPAGPGPVAPPGLERVLGRPLAYLATAAILLAIFGWTFVDNPGRTAPTRDPAYYTWRTEVLLTEDPVRFIEIEGPFGLFSGGYRVAVPVMGAFLRQVADVAPTSTIAVIMVGLPVITALLLAGFAYRHQRDPLMWHAVAFASAGMLTTPPFVGYLDNTVCVFLLAGALWFLGPARTSWPARIGLGLLLLASGFTHPTTLAIFGLTLGAMTAVRFLVLGFDLKATIRHDGPMLLTALTAAVTTVVLWQLGIWGKSISLEESALLFPYTSDFFRDRLVEWVDALRPALNGPLFAIGLVGLLVAGKRWVDNDLARASIMWLAPLVGVLGFVTGAAYPYYRFFNTTLAWVLLIGVGAYFAARFFLDRSRAGRGARLALVGVAGVAVILGSNLSSGLRAVHWNDASRGWLSGNRQDDLDLLRANLDELGEYDRPVVFVLDDEPEPTLSQIWGLTQLGGNTARYGLPPGQIDQGFVYQGSLENYLGGRPTVTGNDAYDDLSREALEDLREGIERAGEEPLVVLASIFNRDGANESIAEGDTAFPDVPDEVDLWVLDERRIEAVSGDTVPPMPSLVFELSQGGGLGQSLWVALAVALLLAPGVLAARWFLPDAGLVERMGIGPVLSIASLVLAGTAALAVARSPFSGGLAWGSLAVTLAVGIWLYLRSGPARVPASP